MNTKLIVKVGLLYRILEGWVGDETIAARLGVNEGDVRRARDWLIIEGFVERAWGEPPSRWLPARRFEELWAQLIPDRACPIKADATVQAAT